MGDFNTSSKARSAILPALVLIAGFVLVLMGMNLFKYYKMKGSFSKNLLSSMEEKEFQRLDSLFKEINGKLLVIKDMGENQAIELSDVKGLNSKFVAFMKNQDIFSGVVLADVKGDEYYLFKKDGKWISRIGRPSNGGFEFTYFEWIPPDKLKKIDVRRSDHDPRKRPWFQNALKKPGVPFWSTVYRFFEKKAMGITVSIGWNTKKKGLMICGLDISLKRLQEFLDFDKKGKNKGLLLLINPEADFYISSKKAGRISDLSSNDAPVIKGLLSKIKTNQSPSKEIDGFQIGDEKWLYSLRALSDKNSGFFLALAFPESELTSGLKRGLFHPDATEILVAIIGAVLLLGLLWKLGLLDRSGKALREPAILRVKRYLDQGEGPRVEFKSTVRKNLKTGKPGKEIELAWLKAVVAFLNSSGGALLIGVDDSGKIVGIKEDGFESEDRCLLHIKNLINQHIGPEFSGFIHVKLVDIAPHLVVLIECDRARFPVFLKIGKNEEFYVRSGPSSMKLSPSQMISYIFQNKKRYKDLKGRG